MHSLDAKLHQLKWLNIHGVKYYLSKQNNDATLTNFRKTASAQRHAKAQEQQLPKEKDQPTIKITTPPQETQPTPQVDDPTMIQLEEQLAHIQTLDELKKFTENFEGCHLKKLATNTVFGDGNQNAKILVIGEAPGDNEDKQAIPFCGESGKLLDSMLASIGLTRTKNIYITNSIFWRPPANRPPTKEEVNICRPILEKLIDIVAPKMIILAGKTAATSLLGNINNNIWQDTHYYKNQYLNQPIVTKVIMHPSYLRRKPLHKKDTWFSLLKLKAIATEMGIIA